MATYLNKYCRTMYAVCCCFFFQTSLLFVHIHISYCVFGMKNGIFMNVWLVLLLFVVCQRRKMNKKYKEEIAQHIIVVIVDV